MTDLVWLVPALPLAGALLLIVFGARIGEPRAGWLATLATASSFVVTVLVYFDLLGMPSEERSHVVRLFSWIPVGSLQIDLAFLADPLSVTMALFVTGIGSLIHLYAIGYMHGDPKFSKFFLYLNLFVFSMLALVLGENLLVTFLGWEGVGACSYFLISFWHTRDSAATAGKKAFVTNRVGDWGVMIADTGWSRLVSKRVSRLVTMPITLPLSTTGRPEILWVRVRVSTSRTVMVGGMVIGSLRMPDSKRFTLATSAACCWGVRFL